MRGRPTVAIHPGCGTSRSNGSPADSLSRPENGGTTSPSDCSTRVFRTRRWRIRARPGRPRSALPGWTTHRRSMSSRPTPRSGIGFGGPAETPMSAADRLRPEDAGRVHPRDPQSRDPQSQDPLPRDPLRIVSIFPTLLGTYGDGGNARILAVRAQARGIAAEVLVIDPGTPLPVDGDIYLLGGGEDDAQVAAARLLRADGGLARAADRGAVIFGVCAGYQLLGHAFPGAGGEIESGLGLLDVTTSRLTRRAVGELLAEPTDATPLQTFLTGYENHAGATVIGAGARPLGQVRHGVGNGTLFAGKPAEGAVQGRIIGTYLHGPGLARNPDLADLLLSMAVGTPLPPWPQPEIEALRAERLASLRG